MKKLIYFLAISLVMSPISLILLSINTVNDPEMIRVVLMVEGDHSINEELFNQPNIEILDHYSSVNGYSAMMSPDAIEEFEEISYISITVDKESKYTSMQDNLDWGVDHTQAERVWGGNEDATDIHLDGYTGKGVKVCIADTGIDSNHPDLNDNFKGGWNFLLNNDNTFDIFGHGTHCAGIVGAEDNGEGVIGIAPEASLYSLQIFDIFGSISDSRLVAAINWAVGNDMDILSLSIGTIFASSSVRTAINNAWDAGLIITAAAGNSYLPWLVYPAAYRGTISVGSINSDNVKSLSSSYGNNLDVVAPGVNIYSTIPRWQGSYSTMSGTSMATPMVAGVCALILSANPNLTNDEVREILHNSATDLGQEGQDFVYGHGLVNAELAVQQALALI